MVYHYICCLKVKVVWVPNPRFDQSFGIYRCQNLIWMDSGGQPSDCLEEEGQSLLFSSILKRLQSEVSQHVGDTSRGAVFVVDEATAVQGLWDPYQQNDIDKLENIQRCATLFINHNYKDRTPGCVTNMLRGLGLQLLHQPQRLCKFYTANFNTFITVGRFSRAANLLPLNPDSSRSRSIIPFIPGFPEREKV